MDESILSKYSTTKKKGVPRSERAEIADKTAQLINQDIKKVLGWTRHLQPDQMYRLFQEASGSPRLWWWNYRQKYAKNNMTKIMEQKLTEFPEFRERKNKNIYLAKWILKEFGRDIETRDANGNLEKTFQSLLNKMQSSEKFTLEDFAMFGKNFASRDRDWRDTLKKRVDLRGSDYDDKDELEEQWERRLGYRN